MEQILIIIDKYIKNKLKVSQDKESAYLYLSDKSNTWIKIKNNHNRNYGGMRIDISDIIDNIKNMLLYSNSFNNDDKVNYLKILNNNINKTKRMIRNYIYDNELEIFNESSKNNVYFDNNTFYNFIDKIHGNIIMDMNVQQNEIIKYSDKNTEKLNKIIDMWTPNKNKLLQSLNKRYTDVDKLYVDKKINITYIISDNNTSGLSTFKNMILHGTKSTVFTKYMLSSEYGNNIDYDYIIIEIESLDKKHQNVDYLTYIMSKMYGIYGYNNIIIIGNEYLNLPHYVDGCIHNMNYLKYRDFSFYAKLNITKINFTATFVNDDSKVDNKTIFLKDKNIHDKIVEYSGSLIDLMIKESS